MYFVAIGDSILLNFENVSSCVRENNSIVLHYIDKKPNKILPPAGKTIDHIWEQLIIELTGQYNETNSLH